jgi:hypothetical protein
MYMERIEVPTEIVEPRQSGTPDRPILTMAVGLVIICLSIVVILPYWTVFAVYASAAFFMRAIRRASMAAYQSAMYAGEVALGR